MNNPATGTPFLDISPYVSLPDNLQPVLAADMDVDVAIVGGGFTGLSTALALHKAGISAVVLEREFCGYGASGRNAGHLTPTICKDMPTAVMLFGKETAGGLVRFADHCVALTEQLIADLAIDCDYKPSGNIMAVVHDSQEARLRKATAIADSVGARVRFLEAGQMREMGIPPAFLCGALEESGGTLHTGKFVLGMRQAALDAGIRIYEQTVVQRVDKGERPRVVTAGGTVSANRVVMASNAYTPEIGKPGNRVCPLYCTLFETRPLSNEQLAAIGGWDGRQGIYTAHESMESYRLTRQRTIIGGAKGVRYFYGGRPGGHGGRSDASSHIVISAFRSRFPELAELDIAHSWAGWIGMTMNFLPIVGSFPGQLYHSVGYNGHGVAQATAMGSLITDLILERENPWLDVIVRKPAYLPPEPWRWLGIRALLGVLNGIDKRVDRKVRKLATR